MSLIHESQEMVKRETARVSFNKDAIYIDGSPVILLCSSVFYFRIPRGLWRDRLRKVKEAGYNAVDVYFPWNHHEREPGIWDFDGERDVEAFLQIAAEEGLWVVARPGPYICSEWDGGALPAYLFTDRAMRLRDNDTEFLGAVNRWFGKIMPILSRYELGKEGGSIIAVQLDNELDFYDCQDPAGYIAALRDMALEHDVTIPLFACAGQGDLYKASGYAEGVMPTCNFYPNDRDPEFEDKVVRYGEVLRERDYPLCVTETNRSHFLLRRLLSGGAKLLGPYLQTSGTDFGFTNATNNWGKPLAFLTSDYDFHGMITPEGAKREEFYEGRLLGGFMRALGNSLAKAVPVPSLLAVQTDLTVNSGMRCMLALDGGGYVVALPNVDARDGHVKLLNGGQVIPQYTELKLSADRCPLLLYEFPLEQWGGEGSIRYATAEPMAVRATQLKLVIVMAAEAGAESELALNLPKGAEVVDEGGAEVHHKGQELVLCYRQGVEGSTEIRFQDGRSLVIRLMERMKASRLQEITADGELCFESEVNGEGAGGVQSEMISLSWKQDKLPTGGSTLPEEWLKLGNQAKHLEEVGIYRGIAWYEAKRQEPVSKPALGLLLQDAGDVLSVYTGGRYAGTVIPGGGYAYLPLDPSIPFSTLLIRAEIWGHSNFDDCALPGLRLNSLKGLSGALSVTRQESLMANWSFRTCPQKQAGEPLSPGDLDLSSSSIQSWGSWMTTRLPESGIFWKKIRTSEDADKWVLHLPEVQCIVRVYVNRQYVAEVHPLNPYIDISAFTEPGTETEVALYMERYYHQPAGKVILYEGNDADQWRVGGCQEKELWNASEAAAPQSTACELPAALLPGELAWLQTELPDGIPAKCRKVRCVGSSVKITAFFNGQMVGRIWLEGSGVRPHMTGGDQDVIYLPEPWYLAGGNRLSLLVEGMGEDAELREFRFI